MHTRGASILSIFLEFFFFFQIACITQERFHQIRISFFMTNFSWGFDYKNKKKKKQLLKAHHKSIVVSGMILRACTFPPLFLLCFSKRSKKKMYIVEHTLGWLHKYNQVFKKMRSLFCRNPQNEGGFLHRVSPHFSLCSVVSKAQNGTAQNDKIVHVFFFLQLLFPLYCRSFICQDLCLPGFISLLLPKQFPPAQKQRKSPLSHS